MPLRLLPLLLPLCAAASPTPPPPRDDSTAAGAPVSVQLDPWCENSIRVRLRPAGGGASSGGPATAFSNAQRHDSVLCLSAECTHSETTSGYTRGAVEGYAPGSADWGFYVSITPQPVTGEYYSRRGASSSQRRAAKSVSISEEGPPPDRTRSFLEPSGRKLTRDDSLHGRWAAAAV